MSDELHLRDMAGWLHESSTCKNNEEKTESSNPTRSLQHIKPCYYPATFFALMISLILFLSVATLGTLMYFYIKQPFRKASRLLSYMDNSVDPCVNFYDFACGRRVKALAMSKKKRVSLASILQDSINEKIRVLLESHEDNEPVYKRKPKMLYSLCMNTDQLTAIGKEPFFKLVDQTGAFPALQPDWDEKDFDLEIMLSNLAKLGLFPLIEIGVISMSGRSFFYVNDGELLFKKYMFTKYEIDLNLFKAYKIWLTSNLLSLNLNIHEDISQEVDDIINLRIEIDERRELMNNTSPNIIFTNVAMLKKNYTWVNWQKLFQSYKLDVQVTDATEVLYKGSRYLDNLSQIIVKTSKRTLANYLMSALFNFTEFLGPNFLKFTETFFKEVEGIKNVELWERCVMLQNVVFPLYVNRMYVETCVNNQDLEHIKKVLDEILIALKSMVDENDWLTEETKSKARMKIKSIQFWIGYSEIIRNDSFVERLYENITVTPNDYFETMINYFTSAANKEHLSTEEMGNDKSIINAVSTNGQWQILSNELVLPAGILQHPLYSSMYTSSMTYGTIGMIIGHELIHALDPRQYSNSWWGKENRDKFLVLSKCFEDQYNHFSFNGKSVNGTSSLEENICDSSGLKLSFKAYKSYIKRRGYKEKKLPGLELNHNQLFFLSFAQACCSHLPDEDKANSINSAHAPDNFRVLGSLQNSKEFAETFNCLPGTPMNPLKKCVMF